MLIASDQTAAAQALHPGPAWLNGGTPHTTPTSSMHALPDPPPAEALGRSLQFVFLLRSDVRPGRHAGDPDAVRLFLVWWALYGRREYPGLGDELPASHRAWLAATVGQLPQDAGLPVSRLMLETWRWRTELAERFPLATMEGRAGFVRWFLVHALVEHDLAAFLSDAQWTQLTTPGAGPATGLAPLHGLMVAAWLSDQDLQHRFDIADPAARSRFRQWYEDGGAAGLVHDRVRRSRQPAPPAATRTFAAPIAPTGINLIGYARGEFGIGEDVRMAARACSAAKIPFSVFDTPTHGSRHRHQDRRLDGLVTDTLPYPINLLCVTGFDTADLHVRDSGALFRDRYSIGYWPWELPEWPEPWRPAFDLVQEIWSSSHYTWQAMAAKAPVPVLHMPMAVEAAPARTYDRADFGLRKDMFIFLFVFDWNSFPARKNPEACVAAFQAAFPESEVPVGLVLKTMGTDPEDPSWQALGRQINGDPRIRIIDQVLDRDHVLGLCEVCDAYVSLHRAEGFGRTLAEAMLLGKPVIASGFSGNLDFCTPDTAALVPVRSVPVPPGAYPHADGLHWGDPDRAAAAAALRRVAFDRAYRQAIAVAGQRLMKQAASPDRIGARYRARLAEIAAGFSAKLIRPPAWQTVVF